MYGLVPDPTSGSELADFRHSLDDDPVDECLGLGCGVEVLFLNEGHPMEQQMVIERSGSP